MNRFEPSGETRLEQDRRIAVALSGGGHRACLFALDALLYLVDAGKAKQLTSIASVSGGSLTMPDPARFDVIAAGAGGSGPDGAGPASPEEPA